MSDTESSSTPSHPIVIVDYCKVCSLPTEYCEYGATAKECLKVNGPHPNNNKSSTSKPTTDATENTTTTTTTTTDTDNKDDVKSAEEKLKNVKIDDSKEASADSKAAASEEPVKVSKKKKEVKNQIIIEVNQRNKRKHVTKISGLELYGIKLSDASKIMAKKFSCGCSVVKSVSNPSAEDIDIQGDFGEELVDLIEEKYPNIPLDEIYFLEDKKKVKAR